MRIMTRIGSKVLDEISQGSDFVKCLHSVGRPENGKISVPSWPCDPERVIILHKPKENEIVSYGSGYGGNSLLGKKCFALRIGSTIGQREGNYKIILSSSCVNNKWKEKNQNKNYDEISGWLAEHMLILGITCPNGMKKYIAAAFPSVRFLINCLLPTSVNNKIYVLL